MEAAVAEREAGMTEWNDARLDDLSKRVDEGFMSVNHRFELVDQRFEQVDQRFEQVDQRFEQVDQRFDRIDRSLERVDDNFKIVNKKIDDNLLLLMGRFDTLQRTLLQATVVMIVGLIGLIATQI